jgi:hypothetical protein
MTKLNDENLIGYLLGALEPDQCAQIEQQLEHDPNLRRRLNELDDQLHSIRPPEFEDSEDPPLDLSERTCAAIDAYESTRKPRRTFYANAQASESRGWSFIDMVVAGGVCLAVSLVFYPAVMNSRFEARSTACQNNLRQLGVSLELYSRDHNEEFPLAKSKGNGACAGYFAPLLKDCGLLDEPDILVCPSSTFSRDVDEWYVPTCDELDRARGQKLIVLQRTMGGSYAYTMGHVANQRLRPTRNLRRSSFVIVADSPSREHAAQGSRNHGTRGQNVLCEDLSVRFVSASSIGGLDDSYYLNRRGRPRAGMDVDDCVVGSSDCPPLPQW